MSETQQAAEAAPESKSKSDPGWASVFRGSGRTQLRMMAKEFGAMRARRGAGEAVSFGGRGVDLVFGPSPGEDNDRIVVHHHIRKTGGTTLRKTMLRCYPGSTRVALAYPDAPGDEIRAWWKKLFALMTDDEQSKLRVVSSHTAGLCLDLVPGAAIGVTMVRDPIDQILSRWFFRKSNAEAGNIDGLLKLYERGEVWWSGNGGPRSPKEDRRYQEYFNPQARSLLAINFDVAELGFAIGPPPDADVWRSRLFSFLSERFLVGIQDAYEASVDRFAHELGWPDDARDLIASTKVNTLRPRAFPLEPGSADLIRSANWLDAELHAEYRRAFGDSGDGRPPGYVINGGSDSAVG